MTDRKPEPGTSGVDKGGIASPLGAPLAGRFGEGADGTTVSGRAAAKQARIADPTGAEFSVGASNDRHLQHD